MMWNEEEAVKEAINDILNFLSKVECWPEDVEYELRKYIWKKYKLKDGSIWRFE